jgi:hypothetical protein
MSDIEEFDTDDGTLIRHIDGLYLYRKCETYCVYSPGDDPTFHGSIEDAEADIASRLQ